MRSKFQNAASVTFFIGILFFLIGMIFVISGCFISVNHSNFLKNAVHTDALITSIERHSYRSNGKTRNDYDVWVKYEADGKTIEGLLGYYNSGMREGDSIDVFYNPDYPSDVRTDSKVFELIFVLIGGIFATIGVILIIVNMRSYSRKKMLMESGNMHIGVITDVVRNNNLKINGRHPFKAECEVLDPFSGEKYLYSSENVTTNISDLVGMEVNVYIDPNDKSKYYVDIFELIDRNKASGRIHDFR